MRQLGTCARLLCCGAALHSSHPCPLSSQASQGQGTRHALPRPHLQHSQQLRLGGQQLAQVLADERQAGKQVLQLLRLPVQPCSRRRAQGEGLGISSRPQGDAAAARYWHTGLHCTQQGPRSTLAASSSSAPAPSPAAQVKPALRPAPSQPPPACVHQVGQRAQHARQQRQVVALKVPRQRAQQLQRRLQAQQRLHAQAAQQDACTRGRAWGRRCGGRRGVAAHAQPGVTRGECRLRGAALRGRALPTISGINLAAAACLQSRPGGAPAAAGSAPAG